MRGQQPLTYTRDFFGGPQSDLPFRAVIVYGATVSPRVVFHDRRFIQGFPENGDNGQQISAYYLETLLDGSAAFGLCLDGGVPDWTVTAESYRPLQDWFLNVSRQMRRAMEKESV